MTPVFIELSLTLLTVTSLSLSQLHSTHLQHNLLVKMYVYSNKNLPVDPEYLPELKELG